MGGTKSSLTSGSGNGTEIDKMSEKTIGNYRFHVLVSSLEPCLGLDYLSLSSKNAGSLPEVKV